jgi:hypothetical protein
MTLQAEHREILKAVIGSILIDMVNLDLSPLQMANAARLISSNHDLGSESLRDRYTSLGLPRDVGFGHWQEPKADGRGSQLLRVDTDYDLVYRGLASEVTEVTWSSPLSSNREE